MGTFVNVSMVPLWLRAVPCYLFVRAVWSNVVQLVLHRQRLLPSPCQHFLDSALQRLTLNTYNPDRIRSETQVKRKFVRKSVEARSINTGTTKHVWAWGHWFRSTLNKLSLDVIRFKNSGNFARPQHSQKRSKYKFLLPVSLLKCYTEIKSDPSCNLTEHRGQCHSPSGTPVTGGLRQNVW